MAEETPKKKTVRKKTANTTTTKKKSASSSSASKEPSSTSPSKKTTSSSTSAKKPSSSTSTRKKRTSTKSSTSRKKTSTPKKKPPSKSSGAQGDEEDNPTMLMVGAIAVAILAVVGLYLMQPNRGDESDTSDETAEVETAEGAQGGGAEGGGEDWATAPSDVAAPPANAQRSATGLASRVITPGTGTAHPGPTDRVTVHYSGWTTDGELFDSSHRRGEPTSFGLNRVIAGWTEGVQLMVVGETRRFWIPANLAYEGRQGPQGMLVFDVQLISIP